MAMTAVHADAAGGPRAHQLAERLLDRAQLQPPLPGVTRRRQVDALAEALLAAPPSSPHGRLLAVSLIPTERRPVPKTVSHRAVRYLLRQGKAPTAALVAETVAQLQRQDQARPNGPGRRGGQRPSAGDGARAARLVAERRRTLGAGPTWRELAREMGWGEREMRSLIRALERAGWLATGTAPRSLRPGPRARSGQQ